MQAFTSVVRPAVDIWELATHAPPPPVHVSPHANHKRIAVSTGIRVVLVSEHQRFTDLWPERPIRRAASACVMPCRASSARTSDDVGFLIVFLRQRRFGTRRAGCGSAAQPSNGRQNACPCRCYPTSRRAPRGKRRSAALADRPAHLFDMGRTNPHTIPKRFHASRTNPTHFVGIFGIFALLLIL